MNFIFLFGRGGNGLLKEEVSERWAEGSVLVEKSKGGYQRRSHGRRQEDVCGKAGRPNCFFAIQADN